MDSEGILAAIAMQARTIEHQKFQLEQQAQTIAAQQKQIEDLTPAPPEAD